MATPDFESLARELHANDIYVGLQTAAGGMMVWITDRNARRRKDMVIEFDREASAWDRDKTASEWVHAMALKLFPEPALRAHPIAELVPQMTADQYGALVHDIREQGLRTPIVMYEGMVLDGRHRARAWYDIHGNWDVPSTEFTGTAEEAIAFVRSHNIKRRHLKPSQIAYYEAQAAAFRNPQHGRPKKNSRISPTQRQIAKEAGVDIETIALAAKAVRAAPEVGPYLRDGKISVNRALNVAKLPEEERLDTLTKPPQRKPATPRPQPAPDGHTDAYADGWRAGIQACARLAKGEGSYGLAAKMRALKRKVPTP
jgi:hypothetical protein